MDKDKAFKIIKEEGIEYVGFMFTDFLGKLYILWVSSSEVDAGLEYGKGFSGFPYFTGHEYSDLLLKPDISSFQVLSLSYGGRKVGMVICNIYRVDKPQVLEEAPRSLLKRAIEKLKKELGANVELNVASEHEFHLVKRNEDGEIRLHDRGSYFSPPPSDKAHELRDEICHALGQIAIKVEKHHHEGLRGKHELDIVYDRALQMADKIQFTKMVIRKVASDHGLIATFMPKPFNVPGGAGWHTHASLFDTKKGKNLFYSAGSEYGLSDLCLQFIAGVLKHAKALAAISNSTVNSYKRLVPGFQAPTYISWAKYNRSTLIRIPPSAPQGTRFEYRASDGLCNHYLFFAALIYAGLDGIAQGAPPPAPTNVDVYALSEEEKKERGIQNMPRSFGEALDELKKDEVIQSALAPLTPRFLQVKGEEWDEYSTRVHEWERQKYLEEQCTRHSEFLETGGKVLI